MTNNPYDQFNITKELMERIEHLRSVIHQHAVDNPEKVNPVSAKVSKLLKDSDASNYTVVVIACLLLASVAPSRVMRVLNEPIKDDFIFMNAVLLTVQDLIDDIKEDDANPTMH